MGKEGGVCTLVSFPPEPDRQPEVLGSLALLVSWLPLSREPGWRVRTFAERTSGSLTSSDPTRLSGRVAHTSVRSQRAIISFEPQALCRREAGHDSEQKSVRLVKTRRGSETRGQGAGARLWKGGVQKISLSQVNQKEC